jgi:hypothetical protein
MMTISSRQHSTVIFLISWIVLSIALSGSALAQFQPKINLLDNRPVDPATDAYRKEVDKEYKSKLKAIPDQPRKNVDPWANARSTNPPQK